VFTEAELNEFRADAESRMHDTCRITRPADVDPDDEREIDDESLAYVDPEPVKVYEGKCRIPRTATGSARSGRSSAGDPGFEVDECPLAIPVSGDGYVDGETVAVGCTVTYLTSARDPDLVGRVYGITGLNHQTEATSRRFKMKEVVGS
jgi:hypothetical protein